MIAFNCDDNIYELEERDLLLKELLMRKPYDVIFLTTTSPYNRDFIYQFVTENGFVIDTDEKPLASDEYGIFMRFLCSVCISIYRVFASASFDFGGSRKHSLTVDAGSRYSAIVSRNECNRPNLIRLFFFVIPTDLREIREMCSFSVQNRTRLGWPTSVS